MYKSLNDAAHINPMLQVGDVKIWYVKQHLLREFCMGLRMAHEDGVTIDKTDPEMTHVLLGSIRSNTEDWVATEQFVEKISNLLQGEIWSPNGEARDLIGDLRCGHTSMSTGDMIEIKGKFYFYDFFGFTEL